MINPIERIKQEKELTNRQIAILLEQSVGNVSHLLNGDFNFIPKRTLLVFEKMGYDANKIQREYLNYRRYEKKQIEQKVMAV